MINTEHYKVKILVDALLTKMLHDGRTELIIEK